jgi:hypothetical protein
LNRAMVGLGVVAIWFWLIERLAGKLSMAMPDDNIYQCSVNGDGATKRR